MVLASPRANLTSQGRQQCPLNDSQGLEGCSSVLLRPYQARTSRRVRTMRTPLARLPSAVGSTSWGLHWNFRPHSRGDTVSSGFSRGFSRAVLIISSVRRFLGLGASRRKERESFRTGTIAKGPCEQHRAKAVSCECPVGVCHADGHPTPLR